jgi:SAM-dependent methyltransferase
VQERPVVRTGGYTDSPWLAELYDLIPHVAGRGDVEFYAACAEAAGPNVLELGCGTGRVLIPLARAGREATGLDRSEHMLAHCRAKLDEEPQGVRDRVGLVQADMRDFDLDRQFALITTPFRPFQHLLEIEDQLACLRCANQHLAPGGRFILDLFQPDPRLLAGEESMEETVDSADVPMPGGGTFTCSHRIVAFHRSRQYNEVELIYDVTRPDGTTERLVHAFPFRYFFPAEVRHLLARSGLRIVDVFGDFDRSPLTDDSPEMIFVAESVL